MILRRIEHRYQLRSGYFTDLLAPNKKAVTGLSLDGLSATERRRVAWHCPADFELRTESERHEILDWVRRNVLSGTTPYRRFQSVSLRTRYGLRFTELTGRKNDQCGAREAPPRLSEELRQLVLFKTSALTPAGFRRNGVWCPETAKQRVEHFSLMFGAFASLPEGPCEGLGLEPAALTFGLLVFPAIWDWYLEWRRRKRGFYTSWEVDMLRLGAAFTRKDTGWLRQSPYLAEVLRSAPPIVSHSDVRQAQADWGAACDALLRHANMRAKEVQRLVRVHRDPFEPILPVLEAAQPVAEYRKITREIARCMPDPCRFPKENAEATRALLMLRLGLHLGVRQRNLRELLVCVGGQQPRSETQLAALGQGEIVWGRRTKSWEVLIPSAAFKNAHSSFFAGRPFKLRLPDLDGLYDSLRHYLRFCRPILLNSASDPGTFFIKTVKSSSRDAAYDKNTFYEAWRLAIERYGIYNPYTGRGAIEGLLPHGPHSVRDVIATHVLKVTGSYEQAGYAIQDTPDVVAKHYGRFLPQDKAALAAAVLNKVWEET